MFMKRALLRTWARAKIQGMENLSSFLLIAWRYKMGVFLFAAAVSVLVAFWDFAKQLLIMALFIALGIASMYYMKYIRFPLGFELNMLGMVIVGKLYGGLAAVIVGCITLFIAELITERLTHSTIVSFFGIIIAGMLLPTFPATWSITVLGIVTVIIYDAIIIPLYIGFGSSVARSLIFLATHIIFNVWVFVFVAPKVFGIFG